MWNFTANNAYPEIYLHDCKTGHINTINNNLIFSLENGFWVHQIGSINLHQKALITDKAEVCFHGIEMESVCVSIYSECKIDETQIRKNISLAKFIELINTESLEYEFIAEYHAYNCFHCHGCIWADSNLQPAECDILIHYNGNIEYRWNKLANK